MTSAKPNKTLVLLRDLRIVIFHYIIRIVHQPTRLLFVPLEALGSYVTRATVRAYGRKEN